VGCRFRQYYRSYLAEAYGENPRLFASHNNLGHKARLHGSHCHWTHDKHLYTSVSFVGSTALAEELMLLGKKYATGVIVTQVVPAVDGHSSLVLDFKSALAKYFPGEPPDYVSLEGYVDANVLIAALQRNRPQLDTEKLVGTFEGLRDLDIGLGTPVIFSRSDHQGVHRVWGTQLDETGHYQPIFLQ